MAVEGAVISCHTIDAWNEQLQKGNESEKLKKGKDMVSITSEGKVIEGRRLEECMIIGRKQLYGRDLYRFFKKWKKSTNHAIDNIREGSLKGENRPMEDVLIRRKEFMDKFYRAFNKWKKSSNHWNLVMRTRWCITDQCRMVVVDFTASWCGPCRFIAPVLAELAKNLPDVTFLKVDVDELKSVAADWAIEAMPTFMFLKAGKIVDKVVGARKEELQLKVMQHISDSSSHAVC